MKKWMFLFLLLPSIGLAQFDVEQRYFRIDARELPEIAELPTSFIKKFKSQQTDSSGKTFSDLLKVTTANYNQPIDMQVALAGNNESFAETPIINYPKVKSKEFGFSVYVNGNGNNQATNRNGIKNIAYKEMRSVILCNPTGNFPVRY